MGRWRADPPSFKLRKFYFLVAAVAITCLVVATMEVTEFFKPNLNVQHHNRLNLMEESPAEYNFDGSPSRKSQPVSDFSHSLPPASPSGSDSSPLNTLLDSSNELLFPNPKSNLERKANEAWSVGGEVSKELMQIDVFPVNLSVWNPRFGTKAESCPESIVISGLQLKDSNNLFLPDYQMKIFKMEDVSMGMWVLLFNETLTKSGNGLRVRYEDNWRFSQAGCVENYLSAHYQSPRHMLCMWEKLNSGHAQCCTL